MFSNVCGNLNAWLYIMYMLLAFVVRILKEVRVFILAKLLFLFLHFHESWMIGGEKK